MMHPIIAESLRGHISEQLLNPTTKKVVPKAPDPSFLAKEENSDVNDDTASHEEKRRRCSKTH